MFTFPEATLANTSPQPTTITKVLQCCHHWMLYGHHPPSNCQSSSGLLMRRLHPNIAAGPRWSTTSTTIGLCRKFGNPLQCIFNLIRGIGRVTQLWITSCVIPVRKCHIPANWMTSDCSHGVTWTNCSSTSPRPGRRCCTSEEPGHTWSLWSSKETVL